MSLFRKVLNYFVQSSPQAQNEYASPAVLAKATVTIERYREVVSDPLNLLVARVPEAGYVDTAGNVILANGHKVPLRGPGSYYDHFSDILIINRGVHEPLEEYCFQEVLNRLGTAIPVMLELGSYWAHYSMWLKQRHPGAICHMVETDPINLEGGRKNFAANGLTGHFHRGLVARTDFTVDTFCRNQGLKHIDILHADIQGYEAEMIEGAAETLAAQRAAWVFVSTHSEALHDSVEHALRNFGYRIEVSSPFENHTTSYDGFILASAPAQASLLNGWQPLGRTEIARATPTKLISSIADRLHTC